MIGCQSEVVAERGFEVRHRLARTPSRPPAQVVIEVAAASLCGTDREVYEWTPSAQAFNLNLPSSPGHEGAGTILEVGARRRPGLQVGDRVALESHLICGQCFPCRTGNAHTCERTGILGMHIDGVFAERVAAPARSASSFPTRVSLEVGALLESAGVACTPSSAPATPSQDRACSSAAADPSAWPSPTSR